ncbi:hypothetical protein TH3_08215 [Thalassospira xiamenensis M-5 = DSM 17429]|uniref:Uncharacterized protein n=1 Tax=Thalassospira xiamenensis M-5 = DSM 17429 TaxID=1123366 RepID=A0AB72UBS4_9PROT|nr:hypothetical protein TH3_08215 [Thalassospira xiamenensis M-5 = DSM 17429]
MAFNNLVILAGWGNLKYKKSVPLDPCAVFIFPKKVLDLFFCLWHKDKVNGRNAPGPKPAKRLVPRGFLRLGPDQRGDQDAAARIEAGRRGSSQEMDRRMAEPLRRRSALALIRF